MRALWLLLLIPGFALANDKANIAAELPYGLFGKPAEPMVQPIKPPAPPSGGQCGPEVPPEFLALLGKMNEPVKESRQDAPSVASKPSPFAGMKRVELRPREKSKDEKTFETVTEAYGITIYRGTGGAPPSKKRADENFGLKVYRGPSELPNKKAAP
jgi:hypothetical protein